MKKLITFLLAIGVLLTFQACDSFLDVNTDPNAATEVPGDILFPTVQTTLSSRTIETGPGTSFHSQLWGPRGSTGVFLNPDRYTISEFTTGNTWSGFYGNALRNLTIMIQQAEEATPPNNNTAAQGKILAAQAYYTLTTLFEDIPFSQANNAEFENPEFDAQRDVLYGVIELAQEGVSQLDFDEEVFVGIVEGDLIYGGDLQNWARFGRSIQLKAYMLLRNGGENVDAEINALLAQDLIRQNSQNAAIAFFDNDDNANNKWQLMNLFSGGDNVWWAGGAALVDLMNEYEDPRRATFLDPLTDSDPPAYAGALPGTTGGVSPAVVSPVSLNVLQRDWPERLITASETLLLEAEFYHRTGNTGAARQALEDGLRASMGFFNGKDGEIPVATQDAFVAQILADFDSRDNAGQLRMIHEQQYIDLFERGQDGWTQWRRTKVPELTMPQNAVLGDFIRRYNYPPAERNSNPNTPAPLSGDAPMWFE